MLFVRLARKLVNNLLLAHLEKVGSLRKEQSLRWPVVFIVGAPRCGSTLVMQVLSDAYDVGFMTNRHCKWFGFPALVEWLTHPLSRKWASDYTSVHGRTMTSSGPSECGEWWYRFFRRRPAYVLKDDVSRGMMQAFRRSIYLFERACNRPLIYKNLYVGLRLEPILAAVPEAVFIVIERDLVDNAQSILKGRYDTYGTYEKWWSVPPPDLEQLSSLAPIEQVVGQIKSIHRLIDRDITRLGVENRVFRMRYEELCQDVHSELKHFEKFMRTLGLEYKRRHEVPERFDPSHSIKIPGELYEGLRRYVAGLDGNGCQAGTDVERLQ